MVMEKSTIRGTLRLNDNYRQVERTEFAPLVFASLYIVFVLCAAIVGYDFYYEGYAERNTETSLRSRREASDGDENHPARMFIKKLFNKNNDDEFIIEINDGIEQPEYDPIEFVVAEDGSGSVSAIPVPASEITEEEETEEAEEEVYSPPVIFSGDLRELYEENQDIVGWLSIDGTVIDYPVMQTPGNEEYYLDRDFYKRYSSAGCLIMDTDATVGDGTKANSYMDGSAPSTNMIVHGHNMRNGSMFGSLDKWRSQDYERNHNIIKFSSLYEEREYEIVSVFLSQVYLKNQTNVFKYYNFFNATNEQEFNNFYSNIKKAALYDTGVTAEWGDEFITLSVCTYHVANGRLVVVGKRIK
ncbi:MAG: class B sortase [Lachnospiraceae bacterium]|nr:class B sortase [Lachnospiraceae bacterium]